MFFLSVPFFLLCEIAEKRQNHKYHYQRGIRAKSMASSLQYYSVVITNSYSNSSPTDGFVDNLRIENYYATTSYALENTSNCSGLSLTLSAAKRRGNFRYHEIIRQLGLVSGFRIDPNSVIGYTSAPLAIIANPTNALLEPASFTFQIIAAGGTSAWNTADETVAGATLFNGLATLTGTACIVRCIERALSGTFYRENDVFDPTATTSAGNSTSGIIRFGTRIDVASTTELGLYGTGTVFQVGPYNTLATLITADATGSPVVKVTTIADG
jgi:hypothetical protein